MPPAATLHRYVRAGLRARKRILRSGADAFPCLKHSGLMSAFALLTVAGAASELSRYALVRTHRFPVSFLGRSPSEHLNEPQRYKR
jgi:hypothetical protein